MENYKFDFKNLVFEAKEPGKASQTALTTVLWFALAITLAVIGGTIALCIILKSYALPALSTLMGAAGIGGVARVGKKVFNVLKQPRGKEP